jgi:hypothetical protein
MESEKLQLFENQTIRTAWDEEHEEWYFAIVDVVRVLTEADSYEAARNYWKVTKHRLIKEGNELVTNCNRLKLKAADGKRRLTDVATTEELLRIIQSIPSKKAEPFKLWLAQVGRERIEENKKSPLNVSIRWLLPFIQFTPYLMATIYDTSRESRSHTGIDNSISKWLWHNSVWY